MCMRLLHRHPWCKATELQVDSFVQKKGTSILDLAYPHRIGVPLSASSTGGKLKSKVLSHTARHSKSGRLRNVKSCGGILRQPVAAREEA